MMTLQAEIFRNSSATYTKSVYQHDKNVTLVFDGIELPDRYEVHFSNQKDRGMSVICSGDPSGVQIPNELLSTGEYIYAWVCGVGESTEDETVYMVVIPVIPRPVPIPMTIVNNIIVQPTTDDNPPDDEGDDEGDDENNNDDNSDENGDDNNGDLDDNSDDLDNNPDDIDENANDDLNNEGD